MLYKITICIVWPIAWLFFRLHVVGRENIPKGAAIISCNHTSLWDPVLLAVGMTPRIPLSFMAKKELFDIPVLGFILRHARVFPVDRNSADLATIRKSISVLKGGEKIAMFPEGRRVRDEKESSSDVKTGIAMIAVRANVPIVPVYLSTNKRLFHRAHIIIGEPITAQMGEGTSSENYKRIAMQVFDTILSMGKEGE
ncbi:MAG: lysophospholipid acyltransferase family protein [Clostridia bacterium]